MLLSSGSRSVLTPRHLRGLAADLLLLVLAAVAGWSVLVLGGRSGAVEPLAGAAVLSAALLLAFFGTLGADRRAQLVAGALGLSVLGALLRPVGGARSELWPLLEHVTMLGVAALLAVAAGWTALGAARGRVLTLAASAAVLVAMASVAVTGAVWPGWVPASSAVLLVGGLGWFGAATAAALLMVVGLVERRVLLRRVGLAVGVQLLAPGFEEPAVLGLAAAVLLLVATGGHLFPVLPRRRVPPRHPARRAAGSGPATQPWVMPDLPGIGTPDEPDDDWIDPAPTAEAGHRSTGGVAAVAPVIGDLALLYRAVGQDVLVEVHGDPWVGMDGGGLSQLLANLLANCSRHAPGAQVRVRAASRGARVRIEVIDAGPGLPPGATARMFRRGVRGPGSTGAGLGLAVCTDLVQRHRGSFTVVSTPTGCTAVIELPTARKTSDQVVSG
jgi:signal transduction histidine kinase